MNPFVRLPLSVIRFSSRVFASENRAQRRANASRGTATSGKASRVINLVTRCVAKISSRAINQMDTMVPYNRNG